jgi:hypothetical protein
VSGIYRQAGNKLAGPQSVKNVQSIQKATCFTELENIFLVLRKITANSMVPDPS